MRLYTIKSEGLAHNSYLITDSNEAAVFDPRRDCQIYTQLAKKKCVRIKYIFETHRNEDYVVGSKDLQDLTEGEICHSKELDFRYGDHNLSDNDTFKVGKLKIKCLYTPGHTNESLCYAVFNPENGEDAIMVFTGDTLFVGSIGRTDLQGPSERAKQAENLYISIQEKLLPLGLHVLIYPAHGAGSVCGHAIGDRDFSTIGYEKKTNPFLKIEKDEFIEQAVSQEILIPPYFRKMEEYNLKGSPPLEELSYPTPLLVDEFEKEMQKTKTNVVDTRLPNAFAGSHISKSLSIWLGGTTIYPGWLLNYNERILLAPERREDIKRISKHLWRLGFDNQYGFLCEGIGEWQETGKPIDHIGVLSARELMENRERFEVLDVREPEEWHEDGYIRGAELIFVGNLASQTEKLDKSKPYAVICSVGKRGSIGSSILKRNGFDQVYNVLGGMTAWKNLKYPVVK